MAITFTNIRQLSTDVNAVIWNNQTKASISYFFRYEVTGSLASDLSIDPMRRQYRSPFLFVRHSNTAGSVDITLEMDSYGTNGTDGSGVSGTFQLKPGSVHHLAMTWDGTGTGEQLIYVDGVSRQIQFPGPKAENTDGVNQPFYLGCASVAGTGGVSFTFDDVYIWNGYVLTSDDVIALMGHTTNNIGASATDRFRWTLDRGTNALGSAVAIGHAGIADVFGTYNFTSFTDDGNGGTAVYADPLIFEIAAITNAYVTTSGKMVGFTFSSITDGSLVMPVSVLTIPTFVVGNDTSVIASGTLTNQFLTDRHQCLLYMFPSGVSAGPSDNVTLSAPSGWVITEVGITAPLSPTFNVRMFGAKGDGITDDSTAIQAALDSVSTGGGTVFVPAGDYRISESLVISKDGTTFTGVGSTSIIRLMDGATRTGISLPFRTGGSVDTSVIVRNVTISNMVIDGNHNAPDPTSYFGIWVQQAYYVTISGVIVRNWVSDGIAIANGYTANDHVTVENSLIKTCARNGIHVGYSTNTVIRGNYITDIPSQSWGASSGNGIDVEVEGYNESSTVPSPYIGPWLLNQFGIRNIPYVVELTIENNIIERMNTQTAGDGIALQPAFGPISNVTVSGNVIRNYQCALETTGAAPYDTGATPAIDQIAITGNWLYYDSDNVVGTTIIIRPGSNIQITSNTINDISNANPWQIELSGASAYDPRIGTVFVLTQYVTVSSNLVFYRYCGVSCVNQADTISITNNQYLSNLIIYPFTCSDSTETNVTQSGNTEFTGTFETTPPSVSFGITDWMIISSAMQIAVNATDAGAGIARVYFFVDGVPHGFSDISPYAFSFDPNQYTAGAHELEAMAIDNFANISSHATINVQVLK